MTPKNVVAWMPESSCFRTLLHSQSVHGCQTLLKFVWHHVYPNFPLIQNKLNQKASLLVRFEIVWLFGNRLAADHMYSGHNWGKSLKQVKIRSISKPETICQKIYCKFTIYTEFCSFWKKGQLYSLNSWEVTDSEKCGFLNARKLLFQNTLPQSKCSGERNTAEIFLAAPLSKFSINWRQIELENISDSPMRNLRTVW